MPDSRLRDRLVAVGVELVAREGAGALSLREIARAAGVSHGAPRRYFPTHTALLAAIAREGYADLGRQVEGLLGGGQVEGLLGGGQVEGLLGGGRADAYPQLLALARLYLDFARTNCGMFNLMFRHDLLRGNQLGLREESRSLFGVLVTLVERARPASPGTPPATVTAGALWANLHGIAQLWQWGSLQVVAEINDVEPLLRATLDAHLRAPGPA